MESLHELICSFLSSVELSREHAGREWKCMHIVFGLGEYVI